MQWAHGHLAVCSYIASYRSWGTGCVVIANHRVCPAQHRGGDLHSAFAVYYNLLLSTIITMTDCGIHR